LAAGVTSASTTAIHYAELEAATAAQIAAATAAGLSTA